MTKCDVEATVSVSVLPFATGASEHQELASHSEEIGDLKTRSSWEMAINQLLDWRKDPSQLADEGILPPTIGIIDLACNLAIILRDKCWSAPLRVVPDGEGGFVFERRDGSVFETISLEATGQVEILSFENAHLIASRVVSALTQGSSSLLSFEEAREISEPESFSFSGSVLLSGDVSLGSAA
jgi:hypothetical protein